MADFTKGILTTAQIETFILPLLSPYERAMLKLAHHNSVNRGDLFLRSFVSPLTPPPEPSDIGGVSGSEFDIEHYNDRVKDGMDAFTNIQYYPVPFGVVREDEDHFATNKKRFRYKSDRMIDYRYPNHAHPNPKYNEDI